MKHLVRHRVSFMCIAATVCGAWLALWYVFVTNTISKAKAESPPAPIDNVQSAQEEFAGLIKEKKQLALKLEDSIQLTRTLHRGASGEDVRGLQTLLNQMAAGAPLALNGKYNRQTADAVKYFQKKNSMYETGIFDRASLIALIEQSASSLDFSLTDADAYPNLWNSISITSTSVDSSVASSTVSDATSTANLSNSDTSSATTSTNIFFPALEKIKRSGARPLINFQLSGDWTSFLIQKNAQVVGSIPATVSIGQPPTAPTIFRQSDGYVYIIADNGELYRLDIDSNELTDMTLGRDGTFADVSPNENVLAWYSKNQKSWTIILQNIVSQSQVSFDVPSQYNQVGNILFSPDGKKIAYVAARTQYGIESAAIYIIDIAKNTQKQTAVTRQANSFFSINKWIDNNSIAYSEQQTGQDYNNN